MIAALGTLFALMLGATILFAFASALADKGRAQRAADLAALSAARSMRDDVERLFEPATINRRPNPYHLTVTQYLRRAEGAALEIAQANGARLRPGDVSFPDEDDFAPSRVRVIVPGVRGESVPAQAVAQAEMVAPLGEGAALEASGQGYSGPLAYRQGKTMRPDVARAFDRMSAAARADGVNLIVTSGYRSDGEQAELFERHPDPRWVAPPGKSLHRFGTELDLGPQSAYGWLARNARRFHFIKRYSWEPWHYETPLALYAGTHIVSGRCSASSWTVSRRAMIGGAGAGRLAKSAPDDARTQAEPARHSLRGGEWIAASQQLLGASRALGRPAQRIDAPGNGALE